MLYVGYTSTKKSFSDFVQQVKTEVEAGAAAEGSSQSMTRYTNTREGRSGELEANYVDFHFDYPDTWQMKPAEPGGVNYVSVERGEESKTYENLNVGYLKSTGSEQGDALLFPQLIAQIQSQFSGQFPGLEKISEGPTNVNEYPGYGALFRTKVTGEGGNPVDVYMRAILLPKPGESKGVGLLMMGTSFSPDLSSAEDLGVKGDLPTILNSFKFTEE